MYFPICIYTCKYNTHNLDRIYYVTVSVGYTNGGRQPSVVMHSLLDVTSVPQEEKGGWGVGKGKKKDRI